VPPLAALRRDVEPEDRRWFDPRRLAAASALAISVVVLARLQVGSWRKGAAFSAGVAVALLALWGASWLLIRAVRRWLPAAWPYVWRQGLANLHRPANQTATVVLAIGFGAFLLGTLFLVQHNLLRTLRITGGPTRPNLVLFDIQPDQLAAVGRALAEGGYPAVGPVPIVPMRIQSIKGRPALVAPADTLDPGDGERGPRDNWAVRREYRSTYRDTLVGSERLVAGDWWPRAGSAMRTSGSNGSPEPPRISVEVELARELRVEVGDEIVWDVQGLRLPTRIASLREVEWARFEPNFFVVFEPGVLEDAPQTLVTLTRIERPADRGVFQRRLAERLPNVTTLDLTVLQETLERLVARVVLAIRFMALFTLATGAVERVSFDGTYNTTPRHAPDGKSFAFLKRDGGRFNIAVQDIASRQVQVLTQGGNDESPSFAPNGRMILYASGQGGRGILAAVSSDGRVKQRLSSAIGGDVREPAWGPLGK